MPPRVREVKRLLRDAGFTVKRTGKGDHTVYYNPTTNQHYSLDGADSHEMAPGSWNYLRKLLKLR